MSPKKIEKLKEVNRQIENTIKKLEYRMFIDGIDHKNQKNSTNHNFVLTQK